MAPKQLSENDKRRMAGAALCVQYAKLERDPGGKGYSEGMAERLRTRTDEVVTEQWLENLRAAIRRNYDEEPVA